MENKITRPFHINHQLNWKYEIPIAQLRKDLDEIEKLGATHVYFDTQYLDYDVAELDIQPVERRLETDQEYQERLDAEERIRNMPIRYITLPNKKRIQP